DVPPRWQPIEHRLDLLLRVGSPALLVRHPIEPDGVPHIGATAEERLTLRSAGRVVDARRCSFQLEQRPRHGYISRTFQAWSRLDSKQPERIQAGSPILVLHHAVREAYSCGEDPDTRLPRKKRLLAVQPGSESHPQLRERELDVVYDTRDFRRVGIHP